MRNNQRFGRGFWHDDVLAEVSYVDTKKGSVSTLFRNSVELLLGLVVVSRRKLVQPKYTFKNVSPHESKLLLSTYGKYGISRYPHGEERERGRRQSRRRRKKMKICDVSSRIFRQGS